MTKEPAGHSTPSRWHKVFGGAPTLEKRRRRTWALSVAAAVFLVLLGFVTHEAATRLLANLLGEYLEEIVEVDVAALKIWMDGERADVTSWAKNPAVRAQVQQLLKVAAKPSVSRDELLASPALLSLREKLQPAIEGGDKLDFIVINRAGLIVASGKEDELVADAVPPSSMGLLALVLQGQSIVTPPMSADDIPSGHAEAVSLPVMAAVAPIPGEGDVSVAALAFLIDPEQDFTRILSVARMGETGTTYAFNGKGIMLSDCRFEEQLKEIGLIPNTPGVRPILNLQIRDPGGDMTKGYRPEESLATRPLTRMAASAVAGESGMAVRGYRDYRGVRVLGAWQWLPEYGFGVATEVSVAEAHSVLLPLRIASWSLLGLLVASAAVILFKSYWVLRLQRRVSEARQLGQYTLLEKIAEGGMGTIYKARHALLRRPTAVKLLKGENIDSKTIARFEREVQLTSQLTHPNTVAIYDYGHTPEGTFYYAMEYLPGIDLAQLIEMDGPIPPARIVFILRQACSSLAEAHGLGLMHRDIKPSNIILCKRWGQADVAKVLDFGLVKEIAESGMMRYTAPDIVVGTPQYIAPERMNDPKSADLRSDIYSIGAVGYNLLTAQDVFDADTPMEICNLVMTTDPPRPSERVDKPIPPVLEQLIMDCLAKEPGDRPQTAKDVVARLDAVDGQTWSQDDARKWWEQNAIKVGEMIRSGQGKTERDEGNATVTAEAERRRI